jgi:O-succinylbenzoate synthase
LSRSWHEIGSGGTVEVRAVDLWMIELPFLDPVATAAGVHESRPLVFVQVIGQSEGRAVEGWGECAALGTTAYDAEDVPASFEALERSLVPGLIEVVSADAGRLPPPSALDGVRRAAPERPLAFAALEMAVADIHLRAEGRSLAALLGVEDRPVGLGAVVGLFPNTDALVARVKVLANEGYTRVKLKIAPGWDVEPLGAVSRAISDVRLQADANGSYSELDGTDLGELDRFGLLCLEQPFDRADLAAHARLATRIGTPICLDEGVGSPDDVRNALAAGACSVVCVKPARLGGLGAALQVIDSCSGSGIPLWMGGMFESGYGRGINTTLAALPGFSWPGDLSPARTYLGDDVVPGLQLSRIGPTGALAAMPPQGLGMGIPPDLRTLERRAGRRQRTEVLGR